MSDQVENSESTPVTVDVKAYKSEYVKNDAGELVLSENDRAAARALFYMGRMAYDPSDTRRIIGRYNAQGEVVKFADIVNPHLNNR